MVDVRCQCGKILCQYEAQIVIIKCRHCKQVLKIDGGAVFKRENHHQETTELLAKPEVVNI